MHEYESWSVFELGETPEGTRSGSVPNDVSSGRQFDGEVASHLRSGLLDGAGSGMGIVVSCTELSSFNMSLHRFQ